jgi:DNA helicase-2/ATP-dependent DNA helicase PcrA
MKFFTIILKYSVKGKYYSRDKIIIRGILKWFEFCLRGGVVVNTSVLISEEQKKIDEIIEIIDKKINSNKNIIGQGNAVDIDSYRKIDENEYRRAVENNKVLHEIKNKPYFGNIIIKYDGDNEIIKQYIGLKDFYNGDNLIISSWAAPIYDIYNRFDNQKFEYEKTERNGKKLIIKGEVYEKRQIDIKDKKVINVIQTGDNITNKVVEKFVEDKINKSKTNSLGSIVETMQKSQNEIIRQQIGNNILVQGCAGSGKSSIAFHRLAYLVYTYSLEEKDVLVISPNNIFKKYTSNLLVEIGSDFNVKQLTICELAKEILKDNFKEFNLKINNKEVNKIKNSKEFKIVLDKYLKLIEDSYIPKENNYIDGISFINYEEVIDIWKVRLSAYKLNKRIEKFRAYFLNLLDKKELKIITEIEKQYENNENEINTYSNRIEGKKIIGELKEEKIIRLSRIKKQMNIIRKMYLKKIKPIDVFEIYYELVSNNNIISKICTNILSERETKILQENSLNYEFDLNDMIPLLYIYTNLYDIQNMYRHVVVDECQDLSYIELGIIESITSTFTLVGDYNQQINITKNCATIKQAEELFEKYTYF